MIKIISFSFFIPFIALGYGILDILIRTFVSILLNVILFFFQTVFSYSPSCHYAIVVTWQFLTRVDWLYSVAFEKVIFLCSNPRIITRSQNNFCIQAWKVVLAWLILWYAQLSWCQFRALCAFTEIDIVEKKWRNEPGSNPGWVCYVHFRIWERRDLSPPH